MCNYLRDSTKPTLVRRVCLHFACPRYHPANHPYYKYMAPHRATPADDPFPSHTRGAHGQRKRVKNSPVDIHTPYVNMCAHAIYHRCPIIITPARGRQDNNIRVPCFNITLCAVGSMCACMCVYARVDVRRKFRIISIRLCVCVCVRRAYVSTLHAHTKYRTTKKNHTNLHNFAPRCSRACARVLSYRSSVNV